MPWTTPTTSKGKRTGEIGLEVAVIGVACRFPKAPDVHAFWENIENGKEVSREELAADGVPETMLDDPNYDRAWGIWTTSNVSTRPFSAIRPSRPRPWIPKHAWPMSASTRPWRTRAIPPAREITPRAFYFSANANPTWEWANQTSFSLEASEIAQLFNASLFASRDFLSTRISDKLDLRGPSYVMNTACSSSLATLHIAADQELADW